MIYLSFLANVLLHIITVGFDAWLSSHSAGGEINRNSSSRKVKAQPIVKIDNNEEVNEVETTYEEDMNQLNARNEDNHENDFDSSNIDREYASAEVLENEEVEIPTPLMIKKELIKSRAKAARESIRCYFIIFDANCVFSIIFLAY